MPQCDISFCNLAGGLLNVYRYIVHVLEHKENYTNTIEEDSGGMNRYRVSILCTGKTLVLLPIVQRGPYSNKLLFIVVCAEIV